MKSIITALLTWLITSLCPGPGYAQAGIAGIIQAGVKKVIKAMDLKVQRMQNKTIWLQNAQKTLENAMSKLQLQEISDWTEKHRAQYEQYFDELAKVKSLVAYHHRIRDIGTRQARLLRAYRQAWSQLSQDQNFSPGELAYMSNIYQGMLEASLKNIEQVLFITRPMETSMSDSQRLDLVNLAADQIEQTYLDLCRFNEQNITLSMQRSKDLKDITQIRKWHAP